MAASGEPARRPRRGPAPIASFDHDGSDESSPESRARLPDIREHEPRARSQSTPAAALAPRIDISRASSSSHHDSRDSSPELALFAGARLDAGFREDGALELRSSTEELAFLEPAPPAPPAPPPERRHSRKDSQGSEAALLAVSGRTSRLSSVGSQCSALSRASRLSAASAASRSPSPHRMLLETSFCGPKPIETDPEISAGDLVEQILGLARAAAPLDARDRREVRVEATVESARPAAPPAPAPSPCPAPVAPPAPAPAEKNEKETKNRTQSEGRQARPRLRREPSEPEVYKSGNRSKDIIRIKLKPDDSCEEEEAARPPATLALAPAAPPAPPTPPSPAGPAVSRKSSFCSLFKSRETIASPESPSEALRRKRSLTEGRARSKSRERSVTPTSAGRLRGSVLSLFRTPRRAPASPGSRAASPAALAPRPLAPPDRLKYYEEAADGIIHIPLRTPPDERRGSDEPAPPAPRPASAPQPRVPPDCAELGRSKPVHRTVLPDGSIIIPLHSPTERAPEAAGPGSGPAEPPARTLEPAPQPAMEAASEPATEEARRRRERLVFTTHVGSREQVFSTQFSITKTPSVTSEISGSFSSYADGAPPPPTAHSPPIAPSPQPSTARTPPAVARSSPLSGARTPPPAARSPPRDSSESEPSSEAAPSRAGNDVEKRGLVVQESFEEELPYVPTTLPQERPVALPMVPVRERGGVRVSGVQRPRAAAAPPPAAPPQPAATPPPSAARDKLRIKLPRRPRTPAAEPRAVAADWIDFEEVPERRKQPKRIQTLPAAASGVVFSYVEPEHCRCECHAREDTPRDASPPERGEPEPCS